MIVQINKCIETIVNENKANYIKECYLTRHEFQHSFLLTITALPYKAANAKSHLLSLNL